MDKGYRGFLFLLTLWSATALASSQNIDSLLSKAESVKSKDFSSYTSILSQIRESEKKLTAEQELYLRYLEAYKLAFTGDPQRAVEKYQSVIRQTERSDLKVRALVSLINIHAITRDFSSGYGAVSSLLETLETLPDALKFTAYQGLAIFFNETNEYDKSLHYATQIPLNSLSGRPLCVTRSILIESKFNLNVLKLGNEVDDAINSCSELQENVMASINILFKAKLMVNQETYSAALELLNNYRQTVLDTHYPVVHAEYFTLLAKVYLAVDNLKLAEQHAKDALASSPLLTSSIMHVEAYNILYSLKKQEGDFEGALNYLEKFYKADKEYFDEQNVSQLAIKKSQIDFLEKKNQLKLLDKENKLLRTEGKLAKTEIENNRLVIAILLLSGALIFIWALVTRKMQKVLKVQARIDRLTGLANRTYFTQMAESAIAHCQRLNQPLTFVIFDLDLFKQVNDNHGHTTGDWALKAAAVTAKAGCRQQDIIGRMGGEEFAIILPGCDADQALRRAEACRSAIEEMDCSGSGVNLAITASFGVADTRTCGYKFDDLYSCADTALYWSKDQGRNRVYKYQGGTVSQSMQEQPS